VRRRLLGATFIAFFVVLHSGAALGGQKDVEERLACQCGCGLTVHTCNHLQCSFAVPVREDIRRSLTAGQTEDEIIARYVAEYGEKVLSAPTREGFNLLAWWGPYAALAVGALGLATFLGRLRRLKPQEPAPVSTGESLDATARAELARELEKFDR
jgi:cytochrome c-type biogenesis protein CcmH